MSTVSWDLEKLASFPKASGIGCGFLSRPGLSALLRVRGAIIGRSIRAGGLNADRCDGIIDGVRHAIEFPPGVWRPVRSSVSVGAMVLAGADILPEQYVKPRGFYVLLSIDDTADAERIFSALAENGEVQMAIQKTFWSQRFGVLTDQFGIPWEINCDQAPI